MAEENGNRDSRSAGPRRGGGRSSSRRGGDGRGGSSRQGGPRGDSSRGGRSDSRGGSRNAARSGPRNESRGGPRGGSRGAPRSQAAAGTSPEKPQSNLGVRTKPVALTAWDLARTRRKTPDTPRGHLMNLRANQRLTEAFEQERAIPQPDRSLVRVREGAKGSVLLIHGVSTRPGDLHELAQVLHDAEYNVYVLRLPDYGTPGNTISEVSWEAALEQARQCYRLLARGGDRVNVVGLGFGATLAIHLAGTESVSSLVLLAPAIMPRESFLQRLVVRMKLHRLGFVHRWLGWNADLMEGMDMARGRLGGLKVPVYAAQCDDDDRASPDSLRILQRKARHRASRFKVFPEGGHTILRAHGDVLFGEIVDFCDGR